MPTSEPRKNAMNRRIILGLSAITAFGLAVLPGESFAQQKSLKEQLVGSWILVQAINTNKDGTKVNLWGDNPKGIITFDAGNHFAKMLLRSDLPKTSSRDKGVPAQDRAIVAGSVAFYGTYSVDEATKTINIQYDGSSFAAFNGTNAKRTIVSLTADEVKMINPATSDGTVADSTWRRAK
jgi:hypothetical protein